MHVKKGVHGSLILLNLLTESTVAHNNTLYIHAYVQMYMPNFIHFVIFSPNFSVIDCLVGCGLHPESGQNIHLMKMLCTSLITEPDFCCFHRRRSQWVHDKICHPTHTYYSDSGLTGHRFLLCVIYLA